MRHYKNVFCIDTIQYIGGVEQYLYEIAHKYGNKYDIAILYRDTKNPEQVRRLEKALGKDNVINYTGGTIYADVCFLPYDIKNFIDNICEGCEVINVTHANLYNQNLPIAYHPRINKYIGVSDYVCEGFRKQSKKDISIETCYNPINIRNEDKDRVLLLVSATRLSVEKGKERMQILADELERNGVKFVWLVFTNRTTNPIKNKHVIYMDPTLDIRPWLNKADYVVQLSSTEGYCYTILESLSLNTPVIVTDLPTFREMGVNEDTGFLLPLDMKDIPIKEIVKGKKKFKYVPKDDNYVAYLSAGKSYDIEPETAMIEVIKPYKDIVLGKRLVKGYRYITDIERARLLVSKGVAKYVEQ